MGAHNEEPLNWGYNCLTPGIHHGRPETIWNLPLFQAAYMFGENELRELVLARIYNDAMQFVEYADIVSTVSTTPEWAAKVKEHSEEIYLHTLKRKIGEIAKYYQSPQWQHEQQGVVERVQKDKLNPHFDPRHPHDSINLLCRIIGTSAEREVS